MTALPQEALYLTPEEYLALEEASPQRHEYINGYVEAMAGGSWDHRTICTTLLISLGAQLRGRPCVPHGQDARVLIRQASRTFYYYPDVVVDCSLARGVEADGPTVIFEVLSDSTRRADQGEKCLNYFTLPSMQAYVLVEQSRPEVTVYRRGPDHSWEREKISGLEATVALPEIGCTIALRDVYDRLSLE